MRKLLDALEAERAKSEQLSNSLTGERGRRSLMHRFANKAARDAKKYKQRAEQLEDENKRLSLTLRIITDADTTDLVLDPTWAQRIARAALNPEGEACS